MPIESPFHARTAALCTSYRWKEWAGYLAVCSYDTSHDREYLAVRNAAGLLDVTPLFKYEVAGPDAAAFLSYVWTRDVHRLKDGQVVYGCFCDEAGKVLDDGTITRFGAEQFRMTSADPSYQWLDRHTAGFDVQVKDVSANIAALALQGPTSRAILAELCGDEIAKLRFFYALKTELAGHEVEVSRTGYTGDLGYEIWMPNAIALDVWDAIMQAGKQHGIHPLGLDALDVTRMEAGFILAGVDYFNSRFAQVDAQKSSPFELGLEWAVHLDRERFIGRDALVAESKRGSGERLVGLDIDWQETEQLYEKHGLPPALCAQGWRDGVPVYQGNRQIGRATSGAWSPILKKNLALATIDGRYSAVGTELRIEATVQYQREKVRATVVERPFYNPERKRSLHTVNPMPGWQPS